MIFIALTIAVLLVFSFVILPGRHFLISVALSATLFAVAHVPPAVVLSVYLLLYAIMNVAIFGLAALLLQGKLGFLFRAVGIGRRRDGQ